MRDQLIVALLALAVSSWGSSTAAEPRSSSRLSFEERVAAQRAIEEVYWRHRIWPKENPGPKPPLDAVLPPEAIRAKVEDYLAKSSALEVWWQRPADAQQLQAELDRMTSGSRAPGILRELFAALHDDAALIAETLARPVLVDRLLRGWYASDERFHGDWFDSWWAEQRGSMSLEVAGAPGSYSFASPEGSECADDTWVSHQLASQRVNHTVVWTGAELIAWGGTAGLADSNTGDRYDPATDSWSATSTGANVPSARNEHSAVWTGTEMIIWGGEVYNGTSQFPGTGGRFNPATNGWTATFPTPTGRERHTAVWTGTEMIVWGGSTLSGSTRSYSLAGERYRPATNDWIQMSSAAPAPPGREYHTAVWTGTEMIVWGGLRQTTCQSSTIYNTGAYYRPSTNTWTSLPLFNPFFNGSLTPRYNHSAVWTGTDMIVWGGRSFDYASDLCEYNYEQFYDTGARYRPAIQQWTPTSTGSNVPVRRDRHTAVWTGHEMIVWGGWSPYQPGAVDTGGRYNPITNSWVATSTATPAPAARADHRAIWTGSQMIVGAGGAEIGLYCASPPDSDGDGIRDDLDSCPEDPLNDADADGVCANLDNCPATFNPGQQNADGDQAGDACDACPQASHNDSDHDTHCDNVDNCPAVPNPDQSNVDHDAYGDVCDPCPIDPTNDPDFDGRCGQDDNCPSVYNPTQTNADGDGLGDACDTCPADPQNDADGDGYCQSGDNCPSAYNPAQSDGDNDRLGDACDPCPTDPLNDADGDGHCEHLDNCPGASNPTQIDRDGDGLGDACDPCPTDSLNDADGDGSCADQDNCPSSYDPGQADFDSDGVGDACDNCPEVANPSQSDFDEDAEGDFCDPDDLVLFQNWLDRGLVAWSPENGETSWNVYAGDLDVLRTTGVYSQSPGSNPLASRTCGLVEAAFEVPDIPPTPKVRFFLVTGVEGGIEGSLGTNSAGSVRPNANPCP